MSVLFVSFIPMYILVNVYPAPRLGAEFKDTILGTWGLTFIIGMISNGFWLIRQAKTRDYIHDALRRLETDTLVLVEISNFDNYGDQQFRAFHKALEEREVRTLRYQFERVRTMPARSLCSTLPFSGTGCIPRLLISAALPTLSGTPALFAILQSDAESSKTNALCSVKVVVCPCFNYVSFEIPWATKSK